MSLRSNPTLWKAISTVSIAVLFISPLHADEPDVAPSQPNQSTAAPPAETPTAPQLNSEVPAPAPTSPQNVPRRLKPTPPPQTPRPQPAPARPYGQQYGSPTNGPQSLEWQHNQSPQNEHDGTLLELQKMQIRLELARQELQIAHQNLELQVQYNRSALENGQTRVYHLKHVNPKLLAETLETFLGRNQLRLVPDQENKLLITFFNADLEDQISKLVHNLDVKTESTSAEPADAPPAQSLQVRIFWLADGIGDSVAEEYLPQAVIKAVRQLGIEHPELVAQSTSSLAVEPGGKNSRDFSFSSNAVVEGEVRTMESHGEILLSDQPQIELRIRIESGFSPIELSGNLSAPLGHYMVLGTASFVANVDEKEEPSSSRFAFVVQVVEAQSFAPEE